MLTSGRFWIGALAGAGFVMFALPWLRGAMASRSAGG
jgi:hypothetical protein